MKRNLKEYMLILTKGMAMGAADVIPGVSGGTIAFVTGIYQELIATINNLGISFFLDFKQKGIKATWKQYNLSFLTYLFLGILISVLSLAKFLKWLLHHEPLLLWAFFFGLVLASILFISKQIEKWNIYVWLGMGFAMLFSYYITIVPPMVSPDHNLFLFFCGFVAIIAMILPGISGAFILLILGAYETFITILNQLTKGVLSFKTDLIQTAVYKILFIAFGAILGLKVFSKILNWMFANAKNITLSILTGFMIGSLNKLWPWKKNVSYRINSDGDEVPFIQESVLPMNYEGDNKILIVVTLIGIGFLTLFVIERLAIQKTNK